MKKKLLIIPLLLISSSFSTGCNSKSNLLTIWVDSKIVDLTKTQIDRFLKENPDCKYTYRVDTVSEQTAATQMIVDVESGADLYIFAQDQFSRLLSAGALASIPTHEEDDKNLEKIVFDRNVLSTSEAGMHTDSTGTKRMYAYPVTSDNGYFLYYNKNKLTETDVQDIDTILNKCDSQNLFAFSMKDGFWYSAGFFFSRKITAVPGGETIYSDPICKSEWSVNPDGTFKDKEDTFCSTNGLIAGRLIDKIYNNEYWLDSHNAEDFSNKAIAVVSGTWDYAEAKKQLGNNLGIAVLPTFKDNDGSRYQIGSFSGCKLLGVKPQTDTNRSYWCAKLASYMTDKDCQLERFKKGWGPSNNEAILDPEVKEDPAVQAINAQNKFAVPQGSYPDKWFKFGEQKICASIKELHQTKKRYLTDDEIMSCLNGYKTQIDELAPDKK